MSACNYFCCICNQRICSSNTDNFVTGDKNMHTQRIEQLACICTQHILYEVRKCKILN